MTPEPAPKDFYFSLAWNPEINVSVGWLQAIF